MVNNVSIFRMGLHSDRTLPDGSTREGPSLTIDQAGSYRVTVTDTTVEDCSAEDAITIYPKCRGCIGNLLKDDIRLEDYIVDRCPELSEDERKEILMTIKLSLDIVKNVEGSTCNMLFSNLMEGDLADIVRDYDDYAQTCDLPALSRSANGLSCDQLLLLASSLTAVLAYFEDCAGMDESCVDVLHDYVGSQPNAAWLYDNTEVLEWVLDLMAATTCEPSIIPEVLDIKKNDDEVVLDRLRELIDVILEDPNALIKGCLDQDPDIDLDSYADLLNFDVPNEVIDQLNSFGLCGMVDQITGVDFRQPCFKIQTIEEGNSQLVNIDDYAVEITTLPDLNMDGQPDAKEEIYQAIRDNFTTLSEGSAIITESNCKPFTPPGALPTTASWQFSPYDSDVDQQLWDTKKIGARFFIEANSTSLLTRALEDNGAVVTSQEGECNWVFSTIRTPRSQSQPFSGHRQFGIRVNAGGNYEFFIRAIDRARTVDALKILSLLKSLCDEKDYFNIANKTWINFQNKIANFLDTENTNIIEPTAVQRDFEEIYKLLHSDESVDFIQCKN